jgi:hypothetical protein
MPTAILYIFKTFAQIKSISDPSKPIAIALAVPPDPEVPAAERST